MPEKESEQSSHGDFFAVDRRNWAAACALGLNAAVAYLVLARFSQRDNRTTAASVHAIEQHTGVARGRAKVAIDALITGRLVRQTRDTSRPLYDLTPFADIREATRGALSGRERGIVDRVRAGGEVAGRERAAARRLAGKGWLREENGGRFAAVAGTDPEWVWLPNTLVTGAGSETPPVELLRQTQDVMTLRLLVDLYYAQNLREDGGVDRRVVWQTHERHRVGARAQYTVWGFAQSASVWMNWGSPVTVVHRREPTPEELAAKKNAGVDFFTRLARLQRLHLLDWVPYVFEGDGATAEPVFPCGQLRSGSIEDQLGLAAYRAAASLLTAEQVAWAQDNSLWLVPLPAHLENVQMIDVARLRYRPRTKLTAAWYGDLRAIGEKWLTAFTAIASGTGLGERAAG
jgi:hypothetical protein